ncbi:MAG: TlpA disulfide reductase family protein [Planctomycetota bacterium]
MSLAMWFALCVLAIASSSRGGEDGPDHQSLDRQEISVLIQRVHHAPASQPSRATHTKGMREEARRHQQLADRIRDFLLKHPDDPARDRFVIAELRSLFFASTTRGEAFGQLQAEINRILAAERSDEVRQAAEYWQLRLDLTDLEGLSLQGRITTADKVALTEQFVSRYPKAMISVPLIEDLIETAQTQRDVDAASRWLKSLREHHPDHVTTLTLVGRENLRRMIGRSFGPNMRTVDGDRVNWKQLRGRVVLVVFWASTNAESVRMLEWTRKMQAAHGENEIVVATISLDGNAAQSREVLRKIGLSGPTVCDEQGWSGELPRRLGIRALPTVLVLDRHGNLCVVQTTPPLQSDSPALDQIVAETLEKTGKTTGPQAEPNIPD